MAEYLDKVKIETAVKPFKDFDLSCQQLTTSSFMRPSVAYFKEFPKCKIKLNLKSYCRMMPLERPVLGSVQIHNRVFFVPMRVIWSPFNAFITNSPYVTDDGTQILSTVPTVTSLTIQELALIYSAPVTEGAFDFTVSGVNYVFSAKGRFFMKLLRQLGYPFLTDTKDAPQTFSALPFLAFAKVWIDWMFPSQYAMTGIAAGVNQLLMHRDIFSLSTGDLDNIVSLCQWSFYKNDYFTSVWDNPVAPSLGTFDSLSIPDITYPDPSNTNSIVNMMSNGTPQMRQNASSSVTLGTQYTHDSLKVLTNYVKRHQLVGSRVLDRYLADFQVKLDSEVLNRSSYLGTQTFPVQFSDVMSNSDTEGAVLGDYAGKGVAYDGQGNFEFDSDEYGYFMVINEIIPDIAYYQGFDKNVEHLKFTDFFQPEFEALGTQAVKRGELYSLFTSPSAFNDIFGYLPRYAEYKVGRDLITGDFILDSRNLGLMSWSTARDVSSYVGAHSLGFVIGDDALQYQRIFYGSETEEDDKFIFVHRVNIKVAMQMTPLYDTYDFDEKHGQEVIMQMNGTKI